MCTYMYFFSLQSVADCVEALIGTYLLSGGVLGAVKVIEWMRIIPPQVCIDIYPYNSNIMYYLSNRGFINQV